MKNLISIFVALVTFGITAGSVAAATTATLSPSAINTSPGAQVSITLSVDPGGTANYAEKLELLYSNDLLDFISFNYSPGWTAITQPEHDSVNESTGTVIKTAGYPNGITSLTQFGTATFRVLKAGTANIRVGSGSLAFQISSQEAITGNTSQVTSVVATPQPKASASAVTRDVTSTSTTVATSTSTTTPQDTEFVDQSITLSSQEAAAGEASSGSNYIWYWLGGIILLLIGVFVLRQRRRTF